MYNFDIMNSASGNMTLLTLDPGCNTPRTPEILNTVLNMQNPLDGFINDVKPPMKTSSLATVSLPANCNASASVTTSGTTTTTTPTTGHLRLISHSDSSNSSSCASQQDIPTTATFANSVQRNRTELIKASLKLTIEQKRKHQCDPDDALLDLDLYSKRVKKSECSDSDDDKMTPITGLTPEDEERRKRRRERNKIAATKCRLKKRERTANLMTESDTLEQQNIDFKLQIDQLRKEQYKLDHVMDAHRRQCVMNIPPTTREKLVTGSSNHRLSGSGLDSGGSPLSNRSLTHQHHHHSYSNNSSPSSVTPVSTLSPSSSANNRPPSVELGTNTYLHSTLELYQSPITGGDCQLQQIRPSSVGGVFFNNAHQMHHQQTGQSSLYTNIVRAHTITNDDCGNDSGYTPHLTDMDQPNGQYDDYDFHGYAADGTTSQNMFTLMA